MNIVERLYIVEKHHTRNVAMNYGTVCLNIVCYEVARPFTMPITLKIIIVEYTEVNHTVYFIIVYNLCSDDNLCSLGIKNVVSNLRTPNHFSMFLKHPSGVKIVNDMRLGDLIRQHYDWTYYLNITFV